MPRISRTIGTIAAFRHSTSTRKSHWRRCSGWRICSGSTRPSSGSITTGRRATARRSRRPSTTRCAGSTDCGLTSGWRLRLFRHRVDRHGVDLMTVLVHDLDEPAVPVAARHDLAVLELAGEDDRFLACSGISEEFHAFAGFQDLLAVAELKAIARHDAFSLGCIVSGGCVRSTMLRGAYLAVPELSSLRIFRWHRVRAEPGLGAFA